MMRCLILRIMILIFLKDLKLRDFKNIVKIFLIEKIVNILYIKKKSFSSSNLYVNLNKDCFKPYILIDSLTLNKILKETEAY